MSTPTPNLRPLSIERKVQAGFALALACLAVIGVVSFQSVRQLRDDQAAIDHTHSVIAALRQVEALINAAESAQRGHTITGDESFLDAYQAATAKLDAELARVRQLTADNPAQQRELDVLGPLVSKRMAVSRQVAEARRREGFPAAQAMTASGAGRLLHGQLVALLARMEQAERTLLVGREAHAQRSATRTQTVVLAGGGLALAAVGLALVLIRRDFAGSRRAEAALRTAHDELEARVAARTAELRASEARLRIVTDNARVGLVVVSPERRYLFANKAYADLLGLASADLVGQRVADVLAPVYEEQIRPRLDRAFAGERVSYELRKPVPDGALLYAVTYEPARTDGSVSHVVAVVLDITERKQAEAIVACQTKVLSLIASGTPLAETLTVMLQSIEGFAPGMLGSVLLLSDDGQRVRQGAAPSLPDSFNCAIDGQPIGPAAGSCGTAAFRREAVIVEDIASDPLWADYRELARAHGLRACWSTPIFDERQRVLGTFAIYYREPGLPAALHRRCVELATSLAAVAIGRTRAGDAMRESEARYHQLFAASPDAVFVVDRTGRFLDCNETAPQRYGYSRAELLQMSARDLAAPDLREQAAARVKEALATGVAFEWRHRCKDDTELPVEISAKPFEIGGQTLILSSVRDITARKQAEDKIREQLDELLRWQAVTLGREGRLLELKSEVNQLLAAQGQPPRYANPEP